MTTNWAAVRAVSREQRIPYYLSGGLSLPERSDVRDIMTY